MKIIENPTAVDFFQEGKEVRKKDVFLRFKDDKLQCVRLGLFERFRRKCFGSFKSTRFETISAKVCEQTGILDQRPTKLLRNLFNKDANRIATFVGQKV